MASSSASSATLPTLMVEDSPLLPVCASLGRPHSGGRRGNSTNSTIITGAPANAILHASQADSRRRGSPTGRCALTRAVSRPSSPISIAAAVSSDCERKNPVSRVKKPRKKITKASRRALNSSVFSASRLTTSVTPASWPSRVPWVTRVAMVAAASRPSSHQRPGNGRPVNASVPRHSSTATTSAAHQAGRYAACGNTIQPISSSRNSVSRVSRGQCDRRASQAVRTSGRVSVSMWPAPPGNAGGGRCRWRVRFQCRAAAGRSPAPAHRLRAPRPSGGPVAPRWAACLRA